MRTGKVREMEANVREMTENIQGKMRPGQKDEAEAEAEADDTLVGRARAGDQEAFGELVRRHRAKAYGFAISMAKDTYLAEDIVQEALVGAFLRLGSLLEPSRFGAWLKRIVRNQAYMSLRRGGLYGKERPASSCMTSSDGIVSSDTEAVLSHLSKAVLERQDLAPEERHLREEMLCGLSDMMHCLSPREREVFEAHFYRQLQPAEIAEWLSTPVTNVYNHLSRSRIKLHQEQIRVHVTGYVQNRRALGKPQKRILDEFGKLF